MCNCNYSCDDGITGTGNCSKCPIGSFLKADVCENCTCVNGECSRVDGKCLSCNSTDYYGENCDLSCPCITGECDYSGQCARCLPLYYGVNCSSLSTCNTSFGIANDGVKGDSHCSSCDITHFGTDCNYPCTCQNGTCNYGPQGTGTCLFCNIDYIGPNCDYYCHCENGACNYNPTTNSSTCLCNEGYLLDLKDNVTCHPCLSMSICSYGSSIVTNTTLTVNQTVIGNLVVDSAIVSLSSSINTLDVNLISSTLSVPEGSQIYIGGNLDSNHSQIIFQGGNIYISGNVYLSDSNLTLSSNSTLDISGCVNLQNIIFELPQQQDISEPYKNITLLTFTDKNCTSINNIQVHSSSSDCIKTTRYTTSVVATIFLDQSECGSIGQSGGFPYWAIITLTIGILLVIIIIILVVIHKVHQFRKSVFPFRNMVENI